MSDRAVFLPYGAETDYGWADVVIPTEAPTEAIHQAADRFAGMGGPHKVFVSRVDDARFLEFRRYLSDEHSMEVGDSGWGYSVRTPGNVDVTEALRAKSE
jgi:hypothetical protein